MANPSTLNLLSGNAFDFTAGLFPQIEFFVQKVSLPGLSTQPVKFPNPFAPMYNPGDNPVFDDLVVTFKVNENMDNWLCLFDWLCSTSTAAQYGTYNKDKIFSPLNLTVHSNKRVPMIEFNFITAFPYSLSALELSSTDGDIMYKDASVAFKYQRFEYKRL